jgi:MerR family copper efflux transcriptional regulator
MRYRASERPEDALIFKVMTTPPETLLRIGEVSTQTQLSVKTVRYYEERGLIQASRRSSGGFRLFDPTVLTRLQFIRRSQALGLSLQDIQDILDIADRGARPCKNVRQKFQAKIEAIDQQITQLQQLREQLLGLIDGADQAEQLDANICPIIEQTIPHTEGI